jgi:hypothetical protein
VYISAIVLLFISVSLLTGSGPLKAIVLVLFVEIVSKYFDVLSNSCTDFCSNVSDLLLLPD